MSAKSDQQPEPVVTAKGSKPLPFGQNLLGIIFLSDDWGEDIPLE
jgi:hypothetical protein